MLSTILSKKQNHETLSMPGILFNILVSCEESNGAIVIAEIQAVPGCEPPRHVHTKEDEVFIIREGSITFFIGDDIIQAKAGDTVYMPVNVPHHFAITSEVASGYMLATPGNIEHFFRSISMVTDDKVISPVQVPTEEQVNHFISQTIAFGMEFV
ncbi:MAG TPA: cupin domain-containing protein [Flavitalea sp.]|nr:cupin domain-containing protein [Flavitalea sp.]